MSANQRAELEAQEDEPQTVEYEPSQLDRDVFNNPTSAAILSSLMKEAIKDATGSGLGKTIIFAKNHVHAVHLCELFAKLYPQYGGAFCRVIDNQEPRADQLIDDFKSKDSEPVIAISHQPCSTRASTCQKVVNLVFAKAVKTPAKFWQMIGRGTRRAQPLRPGQGPGWGSHPRPARHGSSRSTRRSSRRREGHPPKLFEAR